MQSRGRKLILGVGCFRGSLSQWATYLRVVCLCSLQGLPRYLPGEQSMCNGGGIFVGQSQTFDMRLVAHCLPKMSFLRLTLWHSPEDGLPMPAEFCNFPL